LTAKTLFISDLHLSEERPGLTELFLAFLRDAVREGDALYILGDLLEVWLGDDDLGPLHRCVVDALRRVTDRGGAVFALHGNRDFLLGDGFEQLTGARLLPDPSLIELGGLPTLLMHGDTLCTDDIEYQRFRAQVRHPEAQLRFLSLPLPERQRIGREFREQSRLRTGEKAEEIMDVNRRTVAEVMSAHGVSTLIHGHTHRPGIHYLPVDGRLVCRIVLGDWDSGGSVLSYDGERYTLGHWRLPAGAGAEHA
jgi:UDP-2,3-diacylglucosamine hydrolase